ncbi:MAG: cell division protein FtsL [Pyrinomonadaceae bacterium]|nr:cell division protein FtsL [Pyrinomonadaceae bacterium]
MGTKPTFWAKPPYDKRALRQFALLFGCCVVLAGGFVQAASQHFAAIRCGYQSEDLRRERARLLEDQRRLLLKIEKAASPSRLERVARELGMQPASSTQIIASSLRQGRVSGGTSAQREAVRSASTPTGFSSAAHGY